MGVVNLVDQSLDKKTTNPRGGDRIFMEFNLDPWTLDVRYRPPSRIKYD